MDTSTTPCVRWMIRRDMPRILEIEQQSYDQPWTEEEFLSQLRSKSCIGMVAEHSGQILGFVIYQFNQNRVEILNLAVAEGCRRMGIGSMIVQRVNSKLTTMPNKDEVLVLVRESNLPALLMFRKNGFRADGIAHGHYEDTGEDAYVMKRTEEPKKKYEPTNRISSY